MKTSQGGVRHVYSAIMCWLGVIVLASVMYSCNGLGTADGKHLLMKAARDFNASCPKMVDQDTRLDSAFFLPDTAFQYDYTLVNYDVESIDVEGLAKYLKPRIRSNVRLNPDMKIQRDHQVTMVFYYRDRKGDFVTKVLLTPEEY